MPRRVLIAGSTGALGREVVRRSAAAGWTVRALVRDPSRLGDVRDLAAEVHRGDALTAGSLDGACDAVDVVFSCLGASVTSTGWGERRGFLDVDVPANTELVAEAKRAGVRRFVYVSLAGDQEMAPVCRYARAHALVADAVEKSGMDAVILRPTGFFSAFGAMLEMARTIPLPRIDGGHAKSNPIADEDLADAAVMSLDGPLGERVLGGPEVLSRNEVSALVGVALGARVRSMPVPSWWMRACGWMLRPVHPRMADVTEFLATVGSRDLIAPAVGTRRLGEYLAGRAKSLDAGAASRLHLRP